MSSVISSRQDWASHRTAVDRDALEHLLDRHALQGRPLADSSVASAAARDPHFAADRARIALARAGLERRANLAALSGIAIVVAMVVTLSLVMHMPVVDQVARILAAGVVLTLFGLLTRPTRGLLGLLLPLHLAICLSLLGEAGWLATEGAGGWDFTLLVLGVAAGCACWVRERSARALEVDEAELVLKASGRPARLEALRRWMDAAI